MKKKLCMLVLALCMTASVTACTNKEDTKSSTEAKNEDTKEESGKEDNEENKEESSEEVTEDTRIVSVAADEMDQYIKLGEYKGIDAQEDVQEVTDSDVDTQIQMNLAQNPVEVTDKNAEVKSGDVVNIDYEGKKDGVAFDGGTAEGFDLTIGSGTFIDGFEDGLIGAKKGETRDLNLTFPEGYQAEDLAGQDVVFTVTVNAIKTTPELTEEWVKENTEYDSVEKYKDGVRKDLEETNRETAKNTVMGNLWTTIMDSCEVIEYPQEDVDQAMKLFEDNLNKYAQQQNVEPDEFLESQGMTREQFDEQSKDYAEYTVKQNLVVQAIMDAEKFTLVDEKSEEAKKELTANYGVDDISDLVKEFGQETVNQSIALTRVSDFILDNAKVESSIKTDDDKQGFDADAVENEEDDSDLETEGAAE
ncbi:MAG: trigger factor [Eubacteriales bacterium]|nr:trigger factor [Eubacteriales bacterium]